jgi:hypothetical protein
MTSDDRYYCGARGTRVISTSPHSNDGPSDINGPLLLPSTVATGYVTSDDRLKRMFSNIGEAQLLLWHVQWKRDEKIRHPTDGWQWKHFDLSHEEDFSNDPRNIIFGHSIDGMNPFREMSNPHNTLPVIMCIDNLPPWLCHKQKYLLLTTLISSPKQTSIDIDVF